VLTIHQRKKKEQHITNVYTDFNISLCLVTRMKENYSMYVCMYVCMYNSFGNMSKLKYLGEIVRYQNYVYKEIKRKLNSGSAWYRSFKKLLFFHPIFFLCFYRCVF